MSAARAARREEARSGRAAPMHGRAAGSVGTDAAAPLGSSARGTRQTTDARAVASDARLGVRKDGGARARLPGANVRGGG